MKYDVIVVGAGPAGSTAAKCLAEKGRKVALIDKKKFPRDKPCGGGLPTRVLKRFPYTVDLIDSISYGSITYSSSLKYKFKIMRDKPLIATVLRKNFDNGLVKIALAKGVDFLENKTVKDIKIENGKAAAILDDGTKLESNILIGADGVRSIIAEKANLAKKTEDICLCILEEQQMTEKQLDKLFTDKRLVHIFIKTRGLSGYGWVFPKKNYLNIGIGEFETVHNGTKPKTNLKDVFENYIEILKEKKILPKNFTIKNLQGGALPIFPLQKTYSDRLLLCGDAAGFINPITGEGIYYAMVSGEIAANISAKALENGDASEKVLSEYQKIWQNDFGKDLKILGKFNKHWKQDTEKIVRRLTKDKTLAKLIIGVTGGQISVSRYELLLYIRYIYVSIKDFITRDVSD